MLLPATHEVTPADPATAVEPLPAAEPLAAAQPLPAAPRVVEHAVDRLRPLVARAAELDLDDAPGWALLGVAARATVGSLIAGGQLPPHLRLEPDDPPVVVTRTLTAAWTRVTSAPVRRHLR